MDHRFRASLLVLGWIAIEPRAHAQAAAVAAPAPAPTEVVQKKKGGEVRYRPGKGIEVRGGDGFKVRTFFAIESVAQQGHCFGDSCGADSDSMSWHVRRARLAFEVKVPHDLRMNLALQIKNEAIVLKNAYFAWRTKDVELATGFMKPPGGLERDSSTWVKPFPERSVVANFKLDRLLGVRGTRWNADHRLRLAGAVGRSVAGNFDAEEPEDAVVPPAGIEPEDLTKDPGNWNLFASLAWVHSPRYQVGFNAAARIAPDAGLGPKFAEPYETRIVTPRYYHGVFVEGGFDMAAHSDHLRMMFEAVGFRSGETIPHLDPVTMMPLEPTDPMTGFAAYATFGWTPNGVYGDAIDNNPLLAGWGVMTRVEFLEATPGEVTDDAALFVSATSGLEWQATPQLRLQTDLAVQKYNENVWAPNTDAWREYFEVWGQLRM